MSDKIDVTNSKLDLTPANPMVLAYSPIQMVVDMTGDPPEKQEQVKKRVDLAAKAWYDANQDAIKRMKEGLEFCIRAALTMKTPDQQPAKKVVLKAREDKR